MLKKRGNTGFWQRGEEIASNRSNTQSRLRVLCHWQSSFSRKTKGFLDANGLAARLEKCCNGLELDKDHSLNEKGLETAQSHVLHVTVQVPGLLIMRVSLKDVCVATPFAAIVRNLPWHFEQL